MADVIRIYTDEELANKPYSPRGFSQAYAVGDVVEFPMDAQFTEMQFVNPTTKRVTTYDATDRLIVNGKEVENKSISFLTKRDNDKWDDVTRAAMKFDSTLELRNFVRGKKFKCVHAPVNENFNTVEPTFNLISA